MARNLSSWSTKRERQQKWVVFGCLSPNHDHLCFQGNKSVIWIGADFKRGIAAVFIEDLELSATGLWACSLLIFSLCVTYTASGPRTQRLKKPSEPGGKQIHLHFFLWQLELAGEIGGCIPWQLGCSAIYWWQTPGPRRTHWEVGGGWKQV